MSASRALRRVASGAMPSSRAASTSAAPVASTSSAAGETHQAPDGRPSTGSTGHRNDPAWSQMMVKVRERRARRYTADVFEQLGSTQNRDTTWQPHHTLHRPPTPPAVTTSHLVAAGAHLGHSPSLSHRAALPHVYGTRGGICYLDMRQTLPALRRAAQVVKDVVERNGIVVFVGSLKGTERAVFENAKRLGENGFGVTKWLPGTISNAREVFGWCSIPDSVTIERKRGQPEKATALDLKPSLLVLLSPTLNQHALREATANQIPTIGITDTDVDPRMVTYAIPANDDSPRAVELIAGILGMAGKDGLARKMERQAAQEQSMFRRRTGEIQARSMGTNY